MTSSPPPHKQSRPLLKLYLLIGIAFFIWAWYGQLGVVSMATGEVVPASQVKIVQHLEGGIVREILVSEGQQVTAGQALVALDSTASGADVIELKARITSRRIELIRLNAEASIAASPKFPAELARENSGLIAQARQLFDSRIENHKNEIATQSAIIAQRSQDIAEAKGREKNHLKSLGLLNEQIEISTVLLRKDLTNRYNHLDLLKEQSQLEGNVAEDQAALQRASSAKQEAESRLKSINSTYISDIRKQIDGARRELDELLPRLGKFEDSLKRTVVNSPINGVIKILYVATIGGVVAPGGAVAEIVPVGDRLVIDAKLAPQDIGFVHSGQTAKIALASSDAARFDSISGIVESVSPDTIISPEGVPYYRVRINTERDYFARDQLRYDLFPGMQVIAYIETGKRTLLEYLIEPLVGARDIALRER